MKRTFIIITVITAVSLGATLLASVFPKLKATKKELPEVIVNGEPTGVRGYVANFSIEINKSCPRDNPNLKQEQISSDENSEINVSYFKHCSRCNIGVYSEHREEEKREGATVRSCTFCGDKEPQ
jgi:hypothetical protein